MWAKSWKNPVLEEAWIESGLMRKRADRFHVRDGFLQSGERTWLKSKANTP